jgi:hypothetical protein
MPWRRERHVRREAAEREHCVRREAEGRERRVRREAVGRERCVGGGAGAVRAAGAGEVGAVRATGAGGTGVSSTKESVAAPLSRAGVAGCGSLSGRIAAKSASTRCSFGVITLSAPRASCLMTRASMMIMIAPTMARRPLTARSSTAERELPRS